MKHFISPAIVARWIMIIAAAAGLTGCSGSAALTGAGSPAARDGDADGVADADDRCPGTPTGETPDASGCGPSQLDGDQDGVSNAVDQCPETPAGLEADAQGCTRVFSWSTESDPFVGALFTPVPSSYEFNSADEFQQEHYQLDGLVTLLNLLGSLGDFSGGGGEGEGGGGDLEIDAEIVDDSAEVGTVTTLVSATLSGGDLPVEGTLAIIVELAAFDVEFSDDQATWSFDVSVGMTLSGLVSLTSVHYEGTASGTRSADGSTITWTSVSGTVTTSGDLLGEEETVTPLEEVFIGDPDDPEAGVMPAWVIEEP